MFLNRRMRRTLGTGLAAAALLGLAPLTAARAEVPVLVLDGTGYGHGVGLSQWGAEYLARTGRTADQILATFYPGAALGQASGPVRVAVDKPPASTTTLSFPQGGEVRSALDGNQAPGFPVRVGPGGRVRITFDGAYRVDPIVTASAAAPATRYQGDPCPLLVVCGSPTTPPPPPAPTTTTTPPTTSQPPTTASPGPGSGDPGAPGSSTPPPSSGSGSATSSSSVWAVPAQAGVTTVDDRGRSYRGVIEATGGGALRLVNTLGVEEYLRGMAEVPSTWPAAAIQSQTIAARTYALRAMRTGGELCDDARCQVYVGRNAESPGQAAAVAATAGRVLTYGGSLAVAVYSADAGGVSATTLEGFGTPDGVYPYLTTVHYDTDNPLPWHLAVALDDVTARLHYPGSVTGVRVDRAGPSGRALGLVLEGTTGDKSVDGLTFARALGLRSTRFTATVGSADGAPPPPPTGEAIQGLPEDAAVVAQRPVRQAGTAMDRGAAPFRRPTAPSVPESLDPRRHLIGLFALVGLAGLAGAHVPLVLAPPASVGGMVARFRRARPWARWKHLVRRP